MLRLHLQTFQKLTSCACSMMSGLRCKLVCPNGTHDPVDLPDQQPVIVGRSSSMHCVDTCVSVNHVKLTADYKARNVRVLHLGNSSSVVNGNPLLRGESVVATDGNSLFLLADKYENIIQFSEEDVADKKSQRKRKADDSASSPASKSSKLTSKAVADDDEDESDDEAKEAISAKLAAMRKNLAAGSPSPSAASKSESKPTSSHQPPTPTTTSTWTKPDDDLLVYLPKGLTASHKIAAFDLDGTLIDTASGKTFATNVGDWKMLLPEVPGKLKKLAAEGFKIVVLSNQLGISKGHLKEADLKQKIENIVSKFNLPIQVCISTGSGCYRKPCVGMWRHLVTQGNSGVDVNLSESFFVGDAAGRAKGWMDKKKADHSCGDRLFALNVGLKFFTPEEYFLSKKPAAFTMPAFDPKTVTASLSSLLSPTSAKLTLGRQELIVMVGSQASGKSYFVLNHLVPLGYVRVNQDQLKTWQKCVKAMEVALKAGSSVVVDNTNPDVESRSRYVSVAKSLKVASRCFLMSTTKEHAKHNEKFRQLTDKTHHKIADVVVNTYWIKLQEPTLDEGFGEIVRVNFVPNFKDSVEHELLYKQYLLEK